MNSGPRSQAQAHEEETQAPGASLKPMEKRPDSKEPGSAHEKRDDYEEKTQ
jgi:hypothetical protein